MKKTKKIAFILMMISLMTGAVVVNAATPDVTPPTLKEFNIKNKLESYNVGEQVYFNIDASDAVSKMGEVWINICLYDKEGDYPCKSVRASNRASLEVYDFPKKPYIALPEHLVKGEYVVESVSVCDALVNCSSYNLYGYNEAESSFQLKDTITFNINSNKEFEPDYHLDESSIKSLKLDKTTIKPGEKIKATAVVTDEHIDYMSISFYDEDYEVSTSATMSLKSSENGEYTFVGYIKCPYKDGDYRLDGLSIMMKEDDGRTSHGISVGYEKFSYTIKAIGNEDLKPDFELMGILYDAKALIAPSTYKLTLQIQDKNGLVNEAIVTIRNKETENFLLHENLQLDNNGDLTGYINVDQFAPLGEYYISNIEFGMRDSNGNWKFSDVYYRLNENIEVQNVTLFEVIDSDFYEVITSTTDKYMLDKIKKASDSAKIGINAIDDSVIKKEVFEAIQGTNKTIYIESNGIQWVFNGKNIKNPKTIDTSITLKKIENDNLNEKIGKYLDKGIVVNFKDNGELPGVALIKIKTDYAFRDYIGTENLQVYHYNGDDKVMFDEVANNISITQDYDLEFYISHNSSFIISSEKVEEEYVSNNNENLVLNDETIKIDTEEKGKTDDNEKNNNIVMYSVAGLGILAVTVIIIIFVKKKNKPEIGKTKKEEKQKNKEDEYSEEIENDEE